MWDYERLRVSLSGRDEKNKIISWLFVLQRGAKVTLGVSLILLDNFPGAVRSTCRAGYSLKGVPFLWWLLNSNCAFFGGIPRALQNPGTGSSEGLLPPQPRAERGSSTARSACSKESFGSSEGLQVTTAGAFQALLESTLTISLQPFRAQGSKGDR